MIETVHYDDQTRAIIFNEPIPEYRELMLIAASDNQHNLHANYKTDILRSQLFMTMFIINDQPAVMFGLFQEPWMGKAARGLNRFYKPPYAREGTKYGNFNWQINDQRVVNFYKDNPIHKKFNIDTIFITRNYVSARKDAALSKRFKREWQSPFTEHSDILMYKGVPQRFYVWGNADFLKQLPVHRPDV